MKKRRLYVMLGDVVGSRKISNDRSFQHRLAGACETVNRAYSGDLYANFKILKGIDEIGGVLKSAANAFNIVNTILERVHPNSIRFALVRDDIEVGLNTRDVAQMDGPAFHRASSIINTLKNSRLLFDMNVGDEMIDRTIAAGINLILLIKGRWSARQWLMVREYDRFKNQYQVAKKLGISQQAVSKMLNRLMWRELKEIEERLNQVLIEYTHTGWESRNDS